MRYTTWLFGVFLLFVVCDQTDGMFLQAIYSALAAVPLTGGPLTMTAGLAGMKLAVGTKLLYFLGMFGSRGKQAPGPSPVAKSPFQQKPAQFPFPSSSIPQGFSPFPLPYMFGGGGGAFGQPGTPLQGLPLSFSNQQFGGGQGVLPNQLMQAYAGMQGAGGQLLPNQFHGFPGGYGYQGNPQVDFTNAASGGSSSAPFPYPEMNAESLQFNRDAMLNQDGPEDISSEMDQQTSNQMGQPSESGSESDVDNFFNFISEMDDNTCISRLICDIGVDPNFLGEFSRNIDHIISSLEVPPGSRANHYVTIMQQGRAERGGCKERFNQCSEADYEFVKNTAPSVGVPSNMENLNLS